MIEVVLLNYLEEKLSIPVFTEKPSEGIPKEYVILDRTGSSKTNHLPTVTIAFQSYADSKFQAALLNERVKLAIENLVSLPEIRGITLNGDYPFPDVATKQYRYQAVYEIRYY